MKRFSALLFSAALLLSAIFLPEGNAFANTKENAAVISLNSVVNAAVSAEDKYCYIEFEPASTGYFEFVCYTASYDGNIYASICDYDGEVYMQTVGDSTNPNMITAAELTAGETYFFVLETESASYSTAVGVREHTHIYNITQSYKATYNASDASSCDDGGVYTFCAFCDSVRQDAVYYCASQLKLKTKTFTYNGKAKTTTVTVYDRAGNLIDCSQYTVSYKNNKNPGYATVTVKLKGNHSGTMTASMTIKPKKQTVKSLKSAKKKKMTLKWKKDSTVTGYQIQYSTSKKFTGKTTKTVTIKKKSTTQKTISNLKSKKKYFVRIRAYKQSNGKKIYGAWTKTKSVKIK